MGIAGAIYLTVVVYNVLMAFESTRNLLNSLLGTHLTEKDSIWGGWSALDATKEQLTVLLVLFSFFQCFIMVAVPSVMGSGMLGNYAEGSPSEILFSVVYLIWYVAIPYLTFHFTGVSDSLVSAGILAGLFAAQCLVHLWWDYGFGTFWKFQNRAVNGGGSISPSDLVWKLIYRFVGFYLLPWWFAVSYADWYAETAPSGEAESYREAGLRNGWIVAALLIRTYVLTTNSTSTLRQYLSLRQYIPDRAAKEHSPGFFEGIMKSVSKLTGKGMEGMGKGMEGMGEMMGKGMEALGMAPDAQNTPARVQ